MKVLVLFGLCALLVVVTALPRPDDEDNQQTDQRRRLQALQVRIVEDKDGEQKHQYNRNNDDRRNDQDHDVDDDDDDDKEHLRQDNQLDALARRLDGVTKLHGGHGKLRVNYNAPQQRSLTHGVMDLGMLSFSYVPAGSSVDSSIISEKLLDAGLSNMSPYSTGVYHYHPNLIGFRNEQRQGDKTRDLNYRTLLVPTVNMHNTPPPQPRQHYGY